MWLAGIVIGSFLLSLLVFGFVLGHPLYALPIALVAAAAVGTVDFARRRRQTKRLQTFREEAKAEQVEFTPRDKETLASE